MSKTKASILLIAVFIARGTSFLFSKTLLRTMDPLSILSVRFCLAFAILAVVFFKKLRLHGRDALRGGLILGVLYTVCMVLEMYGLRQVDSGIASLIENMAIVLVPVFTAVLTRTPPKMKTMFCALLAVVGVGFLSAAQRSISGSGNGIIFTILAAVTYAFCIMTTEKVSREADPVAIGIIQLGTMGVLSLVLSLLTGSIGLPQTGQQWAMIMMLVLVCSCFGFAFQPLGQKYLPAETAAVFTVVNPLTASILGIAVEGESITPARLTGYVLIFAALFVYHAKGNTAFRKARQQ